MRLSLQRSLHERLPLRRLPNDGLALKHGMTSCGKQMKIYKYE